MTDDRIPGAPGPGSAPTEPDGDERLWAGMVHLGIFLNIVGVLGVLLIYLVKREDSSFVARHAVQALGWQIAVQIVGIAAGVMAALAAVGVILFGGPAIMEYMLMIGAVAVAAILLVIGVAVWAAIRGFQGELFFYPLVGQWLDRQMR